MEEKQVSRRPAGLSIAAAIIIAAIIIGGGLHEVSRNLEAISASLSNQADKQNLIANNLAVENNFPNIMDLDQAASYLNITTDQLRYLANPASGYEIPVLNVNGQYRFSRAALDEWMKTPHNLPIN